MNLENIIASVFRDKRNRLIYYRPQTKTGYVIRNEDERKINAFHHRLILSVAVGAVLYSFINNVLYGVIAAAVTYLIFSIIFFRKVLPSYTAIPNYDVQANTPQKKEDPASTNKLLMLGISYITLGVLIIVSIFYYQNDSVSTALLSVFAVVAIGLGLGRLNDFRKRK